MNISISVVPRKLWVPSSCLTIFEKNLFTIVESFFEAQLSLPVFVPPSGEMQNIVHVVLQTPHPQKKICFVSIIESNKSYFKISCRNIGVLASEMLHDFKC